MDLFLTVGFSILGLILGYLIGFLKKSERNNKVLLNLKNIIEKQNTQINRLSRKLKNCQEQ